MSEANTPSPKTVRTRGSTPRPCRWPGGPNTTSCRRRNSVMASRIGAREWSMGSYLVRVPRRTRSPCRVNQRSRHGPLPTWLEPRPRTATRPGSPTRDPTRGSGEQRSIPKTTALRGVFERGLRPLSAHGFDDVGGDVAQLAVLVLGGVPEDAERRFPVTSLLGHENAERLVDA